MGSIRGRAHFGGALGKGPPRAVLAPERDLKAGQHHVDPEEWLVYVDLGNAGQGGGVCWGGGGVEGEVVKAIDEGA